MISRERIAGLIDEHRVRLALGLGVTLLILLVVLVAGMLSKASAEKDAERLSEEKARLSVHPDEFFIPDEPFPLPGIQYSRKTPPAWPSDAVKLWYNNPDTEMLDGVREPARRQIDDLLESVP